MQERDKDSVTLQHSIEWKIPRSDSKMHLERRGNLVVATGHVIFTAGTSVDYKVVAESLPVGFRPVADNTAIQFSPVNFTILCHRTGKCATIGNPNDGAYAAGAGSWYTNDTMPH